MESKGIKIALVLAIVSLVLPMAWASEMYIVSGDVDYDGRMYIRPFYNLGDGPEYSEDGGSIYSEYNLVMYSEEDELKKYPFDAPETGLVWPAKSFVFNVIIPDQADRLVFQRGGETIYEFEKSSESPFVRNIKAVQKNDGGYFIEWGTSDGDSQNFWHYIYYSVDGGEWQIAALEHPFQNITFYPSNLPEGNLKFKVRASDGFNIGEGVSGEVSVGNHIPYVEINYPINFGVYVYGENISMKSWVYDSEHKTTGEEVFVWESDKDGILGQGKEIEISDLSLGEHVIYFRATDGELRGEDSARINIISSDEPLDVSVKWLNLSEEPLDGGEYGEITAVVSSTKSADVNVTFYDSLDDKVISSKIVSFLQAGTGEVKAIWADVLPGNHKISVRVYTDVDGNPSNNEASISHYVRWGNSVYNKLTGYYSFDYDINESSYKLRADGDLAEGLAAGWTFDSGLGDDSGRWNSISLKGKAKFGWGVRGEGIYLTEGTATINNPSGLDFDTGQAFSACAWVNIIGFNTEFSDILSKMDVRPRYRGWEFGTFDTNGGGDGLHVLLSSAFDGGDYVMASANDVFKRKGWNFACFTYDGGGKAGGIRIYYNGIEQNTGIDRDSLTGSILNTEGVALGSRGGRELNLNGSMDGVAIYSRELSRNEIIEMYSRVAKPIGRCLGGLCTDSTSNWCDGLDLNRDSIINASDRTIFAANYRRGDCSAENDWCGNSDFNKDGKTNIVDLTILAQRLGSTGCSERVGGQNGISGNPVRFFEGGINRSLMLGGNAIEIPASESLNLDNFSLSMWVNSARPERQTVFSRINRGNGIEISIQDRNIILRIGGTDEVINSTESFSDGVWRNIIVTYDGNEAKVYLNGSLIGERHILYEPKVFGNASAYIGASVDGGDAEKLFTGMIDELMIFREPLNELQIKEIYEENYKKVKHSSPKAASATSTSGGGIRDGIDGRGVISGNAVRISAPVAPLQEAGNQPAKISQSISLQSPVERLKYILRAIFLRVIGI